MPRKLKVFRAHLGFYDTIVAAPSQKAALEAWGAGANEFHQGFAAQTEDPDLVAAAREKPGIVLRRQFGTKGPFKSEARLLGVLKTSPQNRLALERRKRKREAEEARKAARAEREAAVRERDEKLQEVTQREKALAEERNAIKADFAKRAGTRGARR